MMENFGKQYDKDDDFKVRVRLHQSKFRAEYLKVDSGEYGNMLTEEDAGKGMNFYNDFGIIHAVHERFGTAYRENLYSNLMRSEPIPFNFFIPLQFDKEFAGKVFNELVPGMAREIKDIKIEYAPEPAMDFLDDPTSFDACIGFTHSDNRKGIFGIEVKYTELGYPVKGKTEKKNIDNKKSRYWTVTRNSGLFLPGAEDNLALDDFRPIWRNHILGESMKQKGDIVHFTSFIFYPAGNAHIARVVEEYRQMINDHNAVIGITFEEFFDSLARHSGNGRFDKWIEYLKRRYLVA